MKPPRPARLFLLALPAAGWLLAACATDDGPQPSFIVITFDTTRADHLGCYGYERDTTPHLDALAARGILFEQMVSASENTLISHASLFTGLFPAAHGTTWRGPGTILSANYQTLAEDFQRADYQTAAFTAHGIWLNREFGMDQGFADFTSSDDDADVVLERAATWLEDRDPSRPFLLFVHLFDVHTKTRGRPYQAKPPFHGRYTSGYDGPLAEWGDELVWDFMYSIPDGEVPVTQEDLQHLADQYDEALAYTDDRVGRFLANLPADVAQQSWICVTADHGEEFMEHGGILHTAFFDEVIRIPWILTPPPSAKVDLGAPRRVAEQVRLVDVRPTLLALAGLASPNYCQGVNLVPWLSGQDSTCPSGPAPVYDAAIRFNGLKLYRMEGKDALFDLRRDPAESRDLSAEPALLGKAATLAQLLEESVRQSEALRREVMSGAEQAAPPLDAEREEQLRQLGYVQGVDEDGR